MMTNYTTRLPLAGEYEIYKTVRGEYIRTLVTDSRQRAVDEVARLIAAGISKYDIYATYDRGRNWAQASAHLLVGPSW